jgi:hypothetical protein
MYQEARITVEVVSAIICFILVRYMIKPYSLTREGRYVGLPLGFAFLGVSYGIAAFAYSELYYFSELLWIQLLTRTFAFVFLAVTYYFSNKPAKNTRILWDLTFSLLIVSLIALFLVIFIFPQVASNNYNESQMYIRVFNIICLLYIVIHTLRTHIRKPDPTTIWVPLGFILFAISQYSLLFWYTDNSLTAFTGSLTLRIMALAVFLAVAYRSFAEGKKTKNEKVSA